MFKEDIARSIGQILKANKYKMIVLSKYCVYFIKRYSDELAFYIRCTDNRNHNGGISVEMFFSPIEIPADNILSLKAGIHMHILTVYRDDITDDVMVSAGEKIIAIEKNIGNLSNVILDELEEPYFHNRRISIYKNARVIYNTIKEDVTISQEFEQLKKDVSKMIKGGKTRQAYQLCHDFVDKLSIDYFRNKGIDLEFSDIRSNFSEQLYAQCVLDV